jgi:competence protein ComEC
LKQVADTPILTRLIFGYCASPISYITNRLKDEAMFFCLLSFSLGAIVLHCTSWLPLLPETFIKVLVFCCFGAAVIFQCLSYFQSSAHFSSHFSSIAGFSQGSKRGLLRLLAVALLFGAGFFYAYLELIQHKQMIVKEPLVDNVLVKSARACSLVREREHYNQIDMCFKLDGAHEELGRYRLSYGKDAFKPYQHACWSLKLALKPPRSTYNPWVSNYERHLFYQRVLGLGRILSASPVECYELRSLDDYVLAMRQLAQSHLQGVYELLQHPGLVEALILGEKSKITAEENRVLAGSGTQHLMAISGLHVGLVCWFFFSSLTLLSMHRFRLVGVAVVGLVYILFVGFSPSAQRAWVMVLCALVMVLGYVPKRPWVGFITALAVVLVLDPIAPLSLGFWFSFSAVGALILMAQLNIAGQQSVSSLKQVLFIQAGLLVFLLFAQSAFAMPLSGLAWLANLIAIPWVSFVVLPLCLMSFVVSFMHDGLALFGFQMADAVLDFLLAFLAALADVDWQWRLPITLWLKAVVFGLALTLLFARFNRAFALSLFLLLFSLLGFDAKKV